MSAHRDARNAFLSSLSDSDLAAFQPHLSGFELRVGSCLHAFGDAVDTVIFPESGMIALCMPLHGESPSAGAVIGRESLVGAIAASVSAPATSDARVLIGGRATSIPARAFRTLLRDNAAVRRQLIRFTIGTFVQANQMALCHAHHPAEARICRWLLEAQERTGLNRIPLTHVMLAQMLGVCRTSVTMLFARLEVAGVLKCGRGCVEIRNQEQLAQHSCDCFSQVRSYMSTLFAPEVKEPGPAEAAARELIGCNSV